MDKLEFKEKVATRTREALAERRRQGRPTGCAPVGFLNARDAEGRPVIVPDPVMAPLVTQAFEMRASGKYSLRQILVIMTEKGLRSRNGRKMGVSGLWSVLNNPTCRDLYEGQQYGSGKTD